MESVASSRMFDRRFALNWPMGLTVLRIALLPVFILLLVHGPAGHGPALIVLAVMGLTDVLDGPLARHLGQVSRLGTLLDPTADKLLVNAAMLLLAIPKVAPAGFCIPLPLVAGVYLKDLGVLIGVTVVRARAGRVKLAAGAYGKVSTASQLLLIFLTLLCPLLMHRSSNVAATVFWIGQWIALAATAAAAVGYSLEGARQLREFQQAGYDFAAAPQAAIF